MIDKMILSGIAKSIAKNVDAEKVYLFGSQASGNATADSDIDLCIVSKDSETRRIEQIRRVRKAVFEEFKAPYDILLYYVADFDERSKVSTSFEHQIVTEGILIYG